MFLWVIGRSCFLGGNWAIVFLCEWLGDRVFCGWLGDRVFLGDWAIVFLEWGWGDRVLVNWAIVFLWLVGRSHFYEVVGRYEKQT